VLVVSVSCVTFPFDGLEVGTMFCKLSPATYTMVMLPSGSIGPVGHAVESDAAKEWLSFEMLETPVLRHLNPRLFVEY